MEIETVRDNHKNITPTLIRDKILPVQIPLNKEESVQVGFCL